MEDLKGAVESPQHSHVFTWVAAVWLALLTGLLGYIVVGQTQLQQELATQTQSAHDQVAQLQAQTGQLDERVANLRTDIDTTAQKVGVTEQQLAKARAQVQRQREEQRKADEEQNAKLTEQQTQLGSLSGDVSSVKTQLQSTVGDLGVQSGLIARTRDELEELKRRGERDYLEFNLPKSKQFTRVGDYSLRLAKADAKRGKYTLSLLVNDRQVEKKDKTIYEPVQFYPQGRSGLVELVVFEVEKNRVAGYISLPKQVAQGRP